MCFNGMRTHLPASLASGKRAHVCTVCPVGGLRVPSSCFVWLPFLLPAHPIPTPPHVTLTDSSEPLCSRGSGEPPGRTEVSLWRGGHATEPRSDPDSLACVLLFRCFGPSGSPGELQFIPYHRRVHFQHGRSICRPLPGEGCGLARDSLLLILQRCCEPVTQRSQ